MLAPAVAIGRNRYAPGLHQPAHAHDEVHISLVLRGGLTERVSRCDEAAGPLSLVMKGRGVEHDDRFGPAGAELFRLTLIGESGERLLDPEARRIAWRWAHGGDAVRPMLRLLSAFHDGALDAAALSIVPDVVAALSSRRDPPRGTPPSWLVRVKARIDDAPEYAGRVDELASSAGVHPVYLTRAFQRWYGCSVSAYRHRGRLRRAASLMTLTSRSLAQVAHEAGFADQPHFCRQFRSHTGLTPAGWRGLALFDPAGSAALESRQVGSVQGDGW
jgi:AraC family transcriptional regulator